MSELDFYDKPDRPWPNPRLCNAAIIGETTTASVKIWIRVYAPGTYWVILAKSPITTLPDAQPEVIENAKTLLKTQENGQPVETQLLGHQKLDFAYDTDLTKVISFKGLEEGTVYYYACFDAQKKHKSPWEFCGDKYQFRTQYETPDTLTFGFYSCNMPYPSGGVRNISQWERMQTILDESDAAFAIGGGDQVYTDGNKHISIWRFLKKVKRKMIAINKKERIEIMKSWYRDIYRGYWGHKQIKAFFARFPQYMIWDDHEIMDGWGSYKSAELAKQLNVWWEWDDPAVNLELANNMRTAAEFVYNEYQHSHNPDTPKGQYDYHYSVANCAFYVADMRGKRNYDRKGSSKVLGLAQMKRIKDWLNTPEVANAKAAFVVLPVPIVHHRNFVVNHMDIGFFGIADDLRDQWEHESNWAERDKLLTAIFECSQQQKKPIAILSGDVHVGAAFVLSNGKYPDAKIFQLTSSAITYGNYHGSLLRLIVKDYGELGHSARSRLGMTSFRNLCVFEENNFGVVRVTGLTSGDLGLSWDLFGASFDHELMVRKGPFKLLKNE